MRAIDFVIRILVVSVLGGNTKASTGLNHTEVDKPTVGAAETTSCKTEELICLHC